MTLDASPTSRFLDLRALTSLEHMRFTASHRIEGSFTGRHPSGHHGGTGEFVDFRDYVEGEDLRRLDWKVLARTGRAHVRLYRDETDLSCMLVMDISGSMDFGTQNAGSEDIRSSGRRAFLSPMAGSKLEYIQYLATALSYLIARQQDQVGLALIADNLQKYIPPGSTNSQVTHMHEVIEKIKTQPATNLSHGLHQLFQQLKQRGILIMMSDFLEDELEEVFRAVRQFRHRHWEVVILHIAHPDEERLPKGSVYRFVGLENEEPLNCSPDEIRHGYQKRFAAHVSAVRSLCMACGYDYHYISTAVPYLQTLNRFLVERRGGI